MADVRELLEHGPPAADAHFLLRVPPDLAARLRAVLRDSSDARPEDAVIALDPCPEDGEGGSAGVLRVGGEVFDAHVAPLPCVGEVYKTYDRTNLVKAGDIGQAIVVTPKGEKPVTAKVKAAHSINGELDEEAELVDGITPPAADARRRHFPEPLDPDLNAKFINSVETDLEYLVKEAYKAAKKDDERSRINYTKMNFGIKDSSQTRDENGEWHT